VSILIFDPDNTIEPELYLRYSVEKSGKYEDVATLLVVILIFPNDPEINDLWLPKKKVSVDKFIVDPEIVIFPLEPEIEFELLPKKKFAVRISNKPLPEVVYLKYDSELATSSKPTPE
jgi:hypothetical protein